MQAGLRLNMKPNTERQAHAERCTQWRAGGVRDEPVAPAARDWLKKHKREPRMKSDSRTPDDDV